MRPTAMQRHRLRAAPQDRPAARGTGARLRTRYDAALDQLEQLLLADAPTEDVRAQAIRVQRVDRELDATGLAPVRDLRDRLG